jgi:hypothetical protein
MLLKTLLTALDRLGVAVITCVAIRTSITAYSIVPSNFIPISSPLKVLGYPGTLRPPYQLSLAMHTTRPTRGVWSEGAVQRCLYEGA